MGQSFLHVLGFFLLNSLLCGFAQDPTAHITLKYNWSQIFWGETVTFRCEIKGGGDTDWMYWWRILGSDTHTENNEYSISKVTESHNGEYRCLGRKNHPQGFTETKWSDPYKLTVTPNKPSVELSADSNIIQSGGVVTLNCNVIPPSSGWKFFWYRGERPAGLKFTQDARFPVSQGGLYRCRGARGDPRYFTQYSSQFTINRILTNRAVVTRQPRWSVIYKGERITLRCDIQDGEVTEWIYEWETTGSSTFPTHSKDPSVSAVVSSGGEYKCMGRHKTDFYFSTEWSSPITLTVSAHKPKAELRADNRDIPVGSSVTLTCSVNPSSGWKYRFWYKEDKLAQSKALEDSGATSAGQIHVSEEGVYLCRGERGDPAYYTEGSEMIIINKKNEEKAVVTLHPNWSEIYSGETMTIRCEIEDVDDNEWKYEWETTSSRSSKKQEEFSICFANTSHSGDYKCRGRKQSDKSSTLWSTPITLTVLYNKPKPVLTVSPSWLSPGDSVTLNCEVKHPSAGWRFFWYKAVPKLPGQSYSYDLLSESSNGTEQYSLIVEGQTHTAGYVCRAGRGDPVLYTDYSEPKFVWSADLQSPASLRVSPKRVQHFTSDSVSLSCEGNSTQWRVMRFLKGGTVAECSARWIKTESSCTIPGKRWSNDLFWCESESGEFSNAVNVTKKNFAIILESPVHPVTEGSSVSLSCKLRNNVTMPPVFFYHNDKLIQNDTRMELNISAVSNSDEGFYRCQCSGEESAQSWMTVRDVQAVSRSWSSFPLILLIVGLICGVIILLLLLLYCNKQFKDSRFCRKDQSVSTNHDFSTSHVVDQSDTQHEQYSTLLHDDASVYHSIKGSADYENVHSGSTNQGCSSSRVVVHSDAQNDQYSTLLHGDASVYETIKGSGN